MPQLNSSQPVLDSDFTLEQELLLCCARTYLNEQTHDRLQLLLKERVDWDELFRLAGQQGVLPLLYLNLKTVILPIAPPAFVRELHLAFQGNVHRSLILTQELLRLVNLFKVAEIPVLSFKGPILAASAFGKLSLRQTGDLDLLVSPEDLDRASNLLIQEGYEIDIDLPYERHLVREEYNIDLHPVVAPKHLVASLSNEEIWQNIEQIDLKGTSIDNITPEVTLLILCLHGTKECWLKLNRICDIAELLRHTSSLNWNQIMERSHRLGSKRLLLLGLQLAVDLLDAPVSAEIQQQIKTDKVVQMFHQKIKQRLFTTPPDTIDEIGRSLFHFQLRERWRDRVDVLRRLMDQSGWFIPTENDKALLPLPESLNFVYYFLRPIRVFMKYGLGSKQAVDLP